MTRGNTSDFIDHHLPKDSLPAHGASHHTGSPGHLPSKFGAVLGGVPSPLIVRNLCFILLVWFLIF